MKQIKIRNKKTGEIRYVFENDLINFKLGGQANKIGIKNSLWSNTYLSKKQIGGRLQQFPTMDGSKPVALVNTPQGVKKVDMINNRTISMDDMFNKDSVQIQGNKAVIVKKNPLKKFIK